MKKIAVNTMKTFLKEHKREDTYTQTFKVADSSFEVVFHTNLSIAEKGAFSPKRKSTLSFFLLSSVFEHSIHIFIQISLHGLRLLTLP